MKRNQTRFLKRSLLILVGAYFGIATVFLMAWLCAKCETNKIININTDLIVDLIDCNVEMNFRGLCYLKITLAAFGSKIKIFTADMPARMVSKFWFIWCYLGPVHESSVKFLTSQLKFLSVGKIFNQSVKLR